MFEQVRDSIFSALFLAAILRVTTPILLPSLGALISERAGVINIGLEGMMLASAFTGAVVSAYSTSVLGPEIAPIWGPWIGLLSGCGIAVLMSLLLGLFHLRFKGDNILAGVALNVLGSAATVAILFELTGNRGDSGSLASYQMPFIQLPEFIRDIPVIGATVFTIFDNQSVMTWIAFISMIVVWYILYRTPFGMHLRASGENPAAAASVGIRVTRVRYQALALSGLFAGLGGIHMSMGYLSLFQRDMTSGRGYIALATPLLGGNNPVGTGAASLIFGFFEALSTRIGSLQIPSQLPQMVPFVAVVLALVIYALQTRQILRVRALRAVEGEHFNASYWRAIQQLSGVHVLLAMIAVIGIIVAVSIIAAPDGFGGASATPIGFALLVVSILLIAVNFPFIARVQRIGEQHWLSLVAAVISLGTYSTMLFALYFDVGGAVVRGVLVSAVIWFVLGGWRLVVPERRKTAAA